MVSGDRRVVSQIQALGRRDRSPDESDRRRELLERYAGYTMTSSEAEELLGYLEEDLRHSSEDRMALLMGTIIGVEWLIETIHMANERAMRVN